MKVLLVFGTRPEAIKMCPLVIELRKHENIECRVCLTGQHREMLRQVMDSFGIQEDYNLDIMRDKQSLTTITADILSKIEEVLHMEKPDILLVHGDTTTSFVASLAAFYQKIPVGHVEAGLRTYDIYSPYPEEMNRQLTARIATYHFSPTNRNKENLQKENIKTPIYVTGNTVIDAFKYTVRENYQFNISQLNSINYEEERVILVTAHRRENWGDSLENICTAISDVAKEYEHVKFVYPVHMNPIVRETVHNILGDIENVILIDPIDVMDMHNLIARCFFVMTDSGGIQEEAPSLGKPVLVLRTETERPEAVEAGTVKIVGVGRNSIYSCVKKLLDNDDEYSKMAHAVNPYGDGSASQRIADIIKQKIV